MCCHRSGRRGVWARRRGFFSDPFDLTSLSRTRPVRAPSVAAPRHLLYVVPVSRFLCKMRNSCARRCSSTAVARAGRNPGIVSELCEAQSSMKISTCNTHGHWNDLLFRSPNGAIVRTVTNPMLPSLAPMLPNALTNHVWTLSASKSNNKRKPHTLLKQIPSVLGQQHVLLSS